ncbi:hypothetical protein LINGRAHAP2_LOCUS24658 [Linum grandiflorum]
MATAE